MNNLLPLAEGETISTVLPLPEDEGEWARLQVVFATAHGFIRKNGMDAFANIPTNGKFAMRFDEDATDPRVGRDAGGLGGDLGGAQGVAGYPFAVDEDASPVQLDPFGEGCEGWSVLGIHRTTE